MLVFSRSTGAVRVVLPPDMTLPSTTPSPLQATPSATLLAQVLSAPFASGSKLTAPLWNTLLAAQSQATPFMRYEYLAALHHSGSAIARTGWSARCIALWKDEQCVELLAACMVYIKPHSYGEYVFDHSWANAYAQHGLDYYPKATLAVPFTPVPGSRLLAIDAETREMLVRAVVQWCEAQGLSSLHVLFGADEDLQACESAGLMLRHTVQFHWQNTSPGYEGFDNFLSHLAPDKRKKIRQERRKVADAGVTFRHAQGTAIGTADWDFFYHCYERTYLEHGNAPYLSRDFFTRMSVTQPESWLLFIAEREGVPIASSLIAINAYPECTTGTINAIEPNDSSIEKVAYGRYWGALERVDCLHFDACYYQPLQWCIANGYTRFEGGAQGEHKMARALLPVKTSSAHWLAHPAFADAVQNYLDREGQGIENYMSDLVQRSPLR